MHHTVEFLQTLTVVLCAAAVTTVLFQRLRQPVVLGYLLAGLAVGPHVPIPLSADMDVVQTLAELDALAADVQVEVLKELDYHEQATALVDHLSNHHRFQGNRQNYEDAENSYLDSVLKRRTGIPTAM